MTCSLSKWLGRFRGSEVIEESGTMRLSRRRRWLGIMSSGVLTTIANFCFILDPASHALLQVATLATLQHSHASMSQNLRMYCDVSNDGLQGTARANDAQMPHHPPGITVKRWKAEHDRHMILFDVCRLTLRFPRCSLHVSSICIG